MNYSLDIWHIPTLIQHPTGKGRRSLWSLKTIYPKSKLRDIMPIKYPQMKRQVNLIFWGEEQAHVANAGFKFTV